MEVLVTTTRIAEVMSAKKANEKLGKSFEECTTEPITVIQVFSDGGTITYRRKVKP